MQAGLLAIGRVARTLVAVMAGAWLAGSAWAAAQAIDLREARFQRTDLAEPGGWETVALPDTWAARGLPLEGSGRYRMQFDVDGVPEGQWALRVDRLGTDHTIRLNDRLLHTRGSHGPDAGRPRPAPALIEFPAHLLREGRNDLEVEWHLGLRAGLSDLRIGPAELLRADYERARVLDQIAPRLLNIAAAALALFMLLIWWRRRQERAIGLFGGLWLLTSLRNFTYFYDAYPRLPGIVSDWLYYVAQAGSVILLGAFAISMASRPWPRFARLLWACGIGMPLLALVAGMFDAIDTLRRFSYPLLVPIAIGALLVLAYEVKRLRVAALTALVLTLAVVVVAGVHDYFFLHGITPITDVFWLPYVTPFAMASFALALVNRLVLAMSAREELAVRLESRVAERTRDLEAANQAKARFLASASHDLRQPVVAIGLLIGMARERVAAPDVRSMLERADEAVRALEDLLRGLLDLARFDAGTVAPRPQAVSLQALFDSIELHERPAAEAKGLRLRFRATSLAVRSDPLLLEQVLRNLVSNAIRYTDRGGVLIAARQRGAARAWLQVWDSGRGIAPQHQAQVFEEFVQLENPERDRRKGVGLGLAIVRRALARLGHRLSLRSQPGRGSCFTIELPLERRAAGARDEQAALEAPLAGRRIWLVDDDLAVREALTERLVAWGAQVRAHARLVELERTIAVGLAPPDWLLTDHRLPDGSGSDAIRRMREHHAGTRILVITGDSAPELLADLEALGVPLLHKPFRPDALLQRLLRTPPAAAG